MLICIRFSRSKILSYLAPVQLLTQLPCQTPPVPSLSKKYYSLVKDRTKLYNCRAIKLTEGFRMLKNSWIKLVVGYIILLIVIS